MKRSDRADLIAGLNEDLAQEYASVIQYRTFASTIRGPHRPSLRPLFSSEIADELGHAGLLADAIAARGGTPTVRPAPVAVVEGAAAMLRSVHEAESAAVERYVERRRQAEALGEHGLVVALDDVIADETRHRDELRLVLDGWTESAAALEVATGAPAAGAVRRAPAVPADRPVDAPSAAREPRHREGGRGVLREPSDTR